jgi:hypothetical protein
MFIFIVTLEAIDMLDRVVAGDIGGGNALRVSYLKRPEFYRSA